MLKIIHPGNPVMRYVRAIVVPLWRVCLFISILWGLFYLGYESAYLLLVGLPFIAWSIIVKINGGPINHNTARNLMTHPVCWLVLLSSFFGIVMVAFTIDFWLAAIPAFLSLAVGYFVVTTTQLLTPGCYACFKETPAVKLKSCPACSMEFEGGGWIGFKKHWEVNHQGIEPYETVWGNMCPVHRKKGTFK